MASGADSSVGRLLSNPWLPACLGSVILALGAWSALSLGPEPHSDWGYYWATAGKVAGYERGGVGLWLLAIPKLMGFSPVVSALVINLASAAAMLWMAWSLDRSRVRWLWLLSCGYLFLIAPYYGIVQLDLVATTQLAAGIWLMVRPSGWPRPLAIALAIVSIAAGVSTKPQYALILWTLSILLAVPWWIWRKRGDVASRVVCVLLAGSILGFAIDSSMRSLGGRSEAIRTNSAVTLYGGLLVSHDGQGCGYWSVEAANAAKADLHKPMHQAVVDRLAEKPLSHWASVMGCKLPQILRPPPYALYWLVESPNIRMAIDAHPRKDEIESKYYTLLRFEKKAYALLTLTILIVSFATSTMVWRRGARLASLVPAVWFISFWAVHLVFEIQGRYFIGLYLIAPLLCMMAFAFARREPAGVPRKLGHASSQPESK